MRKLAIKSVKSDMSSYGRFIWPKSGEVICKDWIKNERCGNGFHAWYMGIGDYSLKVNDVDAVWILLDITSDMVDLNGKVKFEKCNVLSTGTFSSIFRELLDSPEWKNQLMLTGKYAPSATTGKYVNSATTGFSAHSATTGFSAHSATTGDSAHSATTGEDAHSTTTGFSAHSTTTGDDAHSATTGFSAHSATTGFSAHSATTGNHAHSATTGKNSIACCLGYGNTRAKSNDSGAIILAEFNDDKSIKKIHVGYIGRTEGLKANTWYCIKDGQFSEVEA